MVLRCILRMPCFQYRKSYTDTMSALPNIMCQRARVSHSLSAQPGTAHAVRRWLRIFIWWPQHDNHLKPRLHSSAFGPFYRDKAASPASNTARQGFLHKLCITGNHSHNLLSPYFCCMGPPHLGIQAQEWPAVCCEPSPYCGVVASRSDGWLHGRPSILVCSDFLCWVHDLAAEPLSRRRIEEAEAREIPKETSSNFFALTSGLKRRDSVRGAFRAWYSASSTC